MNWFVIHTKPRQENRALQNLTLQGFPCFLPTVPVEKIRQGELSVVIEPLFPRYLFIQLDLGESSRSWAPIRSTKGVSCLVAFGNEPAKVDARLIELLLNRQQAAASEPQRLFNQGERVLVTEGPFAGVEAVYNMADGEQRAIVLIELLNKKVPLKVAPAGIKKIA